jgi:5-methylcytosine-specific restriction endonuclease McrA
LNLEFTRPGTAWRGKARLGPAWRGAAWQDKVSIMPKHRPPREVWKVLRERVWQRDGKKCVRCQTPVALNEFHCDHIRSGKLGTNEMSNLRCLCRRCHVLRADHRHRGMVAGALKDGIIPPNWRELVWEDF